MYFSPGSWILKNGESGVSLIVPKSIKTKFQFYFPYNTAFLPLRGWVSNENIVFLIALQKCTVFNFSTKIPGESISKHVDITINLNKTHFHTLLNAYRISYFMAEKLYIKCIVQIYRWKYYNRIIPKQTTHSIRKYRSFIGNLPSR